MVIIVTGAAGATVGTVVAELLGEEATVTEAATSVGTAELGRAAVSTAPPLTSSGGRLRVDVMSTVLHPLPSTTAADPRSRLGVHVRIMNNTDDDFELALPLLFVDEDRHRVRATPSTAGAGLPAVLEADGVADTTLNFDLTSVYAGELATLPLVLRVATKNLALVPVMGSTLRG